MFLFCSRSLAKERWTDFCVKEYYICEIMYDMHMCLYFQQMDNLEVVCMV